MKSIRFAAFLLAAAAFAQPAFSMGFGFIGTGGIGKTDYLSSRSGDDIYKVDYSKVNAFYGGGLLFDTGNPEDGYHNRIGLTLEGVSTTGGRYNFKHVFRGGFVNTFAFKAAGSEGFRFWLGPLIGLHYLTGKYETHRNQEWSPDRKRWFVAANLAFAGSGLEPF
jgi:hypothetical protein